MPRLRALAVAAVVAPMAVLATAKPASPPLLVSVRTDGGAANHNCYESAVSNNGKVVAFRSYANNLDERAGIYSEQIYVRDLAKGTTVLASTHQNTAFGSDCYNPNLSANGRLLLFQSYAAQINPPDDTTTSDLYLLDRRTGDLRVVSLNDEGDVGSSDTFLDGAALSGNGRWAVAYSTSTNLTGDPVNGIDYQVFLFDLRTGAVTLVSKRMDGAGGTGYSVQPTLSPNGRWLAFDSAATELRGIEGNGYYQIYLLDTKRGTLVRASNNLSGGPVNGDCTYPSVANNGVVTFSTGATDIDGDEDGYYDSFLFDPRGAGSTRRLTEDAAGASPAGSCYRTAVSPSGKVVVFSTDQALVASDTNGYEDLYSLDLARGTLRIVSRDAMGNPGNSISTMTAAGLSRNGKWMSFSTTSSSLIPSDGNEGSDVLLADPLR